MTGRRDIPSLLASNQAGPAGEDYSAAFAAALYFLSYRPRSEHEVRRRLARNYPAPVIERVMASLQQYGYLDDAAFAQLWRRAREQRRPRGVRALQQELRQFGVAKEVIAEALEGYDSEGNAYRAALKPARRLAAKGESPELFRRRLSAHLLRRGFEYSVVSGTVNRLWQELAAQSLPGQEDPNNQEQHGPHTKEEYAGSSDKVN